MIRVGITGQSGFIGAHLTYCLQQKSDEFELINFSKEYFEDNEKLKGFVTHCDCIVHLAAMNRGEPDEIYNCNVGLVKKLVAAIEAAEQTPHIIFSSSTQEQGKSVYGASKKEGHRIFQEWSVRSKGKYTGLAIPNVFGAFGKPFYNSVVATFCHQLAHDQEPEVKIDAELSLIYVDDLAAHICKIIQAEGAAVPELSPTTDIKVTEILHRLKKVRDSYIEQHTIPELNSHFDVSLFNTFRTYLEDDYYPVSLTLHSDNRGWLFEVIKSGSGGQTFFFLDQAGSDAGQPLPYKKNRAFLRSTRGGPHKTTKNRF